MTAKKKEYRSVYTKRLSTTTQNQAILWYNREYHRIDFLEMEVRAAIVEVFLPRY
jgi:hypothetical protein